MNDFVDRLLGRPGAVPIRPVVPMLFEPVAPLRTPPALPMGTFSESGPPGEPVAPRDGPSPVPIVVPVAEPVTFVRESRETHETRVEPAAPQRQPGRLVRETVREVPQERDDPVALPVPIGTAAPVVAAPAAPAAKALRAAELPAAASTAATSTAAAPTAVAATTASEPVRAHPVTRARPGPAPAGPPRPPMARRAAEPAGPDVHISIGRVEIKAVPGPAPAPRPERHRRPVLGLDEYLKERAGGDRG